MTTRFLLAFLYIILSFPAYPGSIDNCNIVWTNQSSGSDESMPCGGGSIGMNVWVENNDLYFYFSHSGTFDENNGFLKGGRIKLHLTPNPFESETFRQELVLNEGFVRIQAGEGKEQVDIELWSDVFRPVIHLDVKSKSKIEAEVSYESWRYKDHLIREDESHFNSYKFRMPAGLTTRKDSIGFDGNGVAFFHQNGAYTVFDETVKSQGMEKVKHEMMNPLGNLIFGGQLSGKNFVAGHTYTGRYKDTDFMGWNLKSKAPSATHTIAISLHNEQTPALSDWQKSLDNLIAESNRDKNAQQKTRKWWHEFWNKSYIHINSGKGESDEAWKVGRNYQLFRYMLACNAYGSEPTKFNGGLFTFDPVFVDEKRAFTPDFRLWGGGTMTAQNQRLVYFPMIKSGDFDMMKTQFNFYERMLRNAELRSQVYWGHPGASFTEQIENFGLPNIRENEWKPRNEGSDPGVESNPWLEYVWDTALEFGLMMLDCHLYNNEAIEPHIPFIESVLTFFDEHYRYLAARRGTSDLDGSGHLVIYPGSACETYKMATNPVSTVAALSTILKRLIELDEGEVTTEQKQRWESMLQRIPPLSFREIEGKTSISPAKMWERISNGESPQLYPVYPWRIYGIGRPDIDVAIHTYFHDPEVQEFKSHIGWKQHNIFAACLGLTEEAKQLTLLKLGDGPHRFPAFWGNGFDWTPDHNWGGSGIIGLQEMLVQTDGDKILLFPAWPTEWDVHFKLHLPHKTIVEVKRQNGKVTLLDVQPQARKKDIILQTP